MPTLHEEVMSNFGKRLRTARQNAGFQHAKDFANTLGVPEHTYRAWEAGRNQPDLHMLTRLCRALDIEPNYLLPLAIKRKNGRPPAVSHSA